VYGGFDGDGDDDQSVGRFGWVLDFKGGGPVSV
jgi:hypothetical protein